MKTGLERIKKDAPIDVVGIGSALLDLIVDIKDEALDRLGLVKGSMQLIDEERSGEIMGLIKNMEVRVAPGGSAANTVAGLSRFGGTGLFMGKVGKDKNGDIYIRETERFGIESGIVRDDGLTGHAITFITTDSERTFATHLGAAQRFSSGDVDRKALGRGKILHLEGYLFEPPALREACFYAMDAARQEGALISVDLSDPELIKRIAPVFRQVLGEYAGIVFVNEEEAVAYTGKEEESALADLAGVCDVAVVKLGSRGSIIGYGGNIHRVPVYQTEVVNTNGAGDMYAAGVLYGICRGVAIEDCGRYGSYASSLVVSQVGARYPHRISTDSI